MIFLKKPLKSFGATILMVLERPRVTTTTGFDGKKAAVLTVFFYRRLLSHVLGNINNSQRVTQREFHYFFCFFLKLSHVPGGINIFVVESKSTIRILLKVTSLELNNFTLIFCKIVTRPRWH